MKIKPGKITAYLKRYATDSGSIDTNVAATYTQGKGAEDNVNMPGLVDASATAYSEMVGNTNPSQLKLFVDRAVAALSAGDASAIYISDGVRKISGDKVNAALEI